jgi:ATP-binding cassette subfamily B protein/subfamily B ATP-binding cassette protein MsbA
MPAQSSRRRFAEYRNQIRQRKNAGEAVEVSPHGVSPGAGRSRKLGDRQRGFGELFVRFWGLLRGHRGAVVAALGMLTVSTILRLIPPAGTKVVIDSVLTDPPKPLPDVLSGLTLPSEPIALLVAVAVAVTVVTIVATVISVYGRWLATKTVNRTQVSIRRIVFQHAIRLPLNKVQNLKSGGVASLIREDAGGVADLIFSMLYNPWRAIIQFVGSLIILTLVDWKLMVGGALLLPAVWITHRTWINRVRPLYRDIRKQRQSIDSGATETFGGIRVVRTFARDRSETGRYVREGDFMVRQQLFTWWWTRAIEIVWEVLIPLASTGLLVYGGYQILNNQLTLGDLMMFLVYLTMLLDPLATLAGSAVTFQNNLAGLDRVLDVLEEDNELPTRPGAVTVEKSLVRGELTLRDVTFAYPETEAPVLSEVNLQIDAGQTIALVGRSGAGKTTLTNLISRFYDPVAGTISLDGRDLRDIELDSYRRLLGIVEQDVFLFDGTIRDNIAYARNGASDEEVVHAAQAAAAWEFIERLPEGLQSWIGERGVKLSGGQRQRLAIARAILADPKLLILDEATSNLDSESERLIQDSLANLLEGRTAIVIAHRLSTIMNADKIVVLENGRIIEQGTHQSLLGDGGKYRDMVHMQMDSQLQPQP